MLESIKLPGTRRQTTRLGFGCSDLMGGLSERESLRLLETAFDAGIQHFDVAPSYGHGQAERCLGKFLRGKTDCVTIATKYGILPPSQAGLLNAARTVLRPFARKLPAVRNRLAHAAAGLKTKAHFSAQEAQRSLEHSLRELELERIDLWLLHEATAADLDGSDLLPFLQQTQQEGRIGAFGCGTERGNLKALWERHPEFCPALQYEWSVMEKSPDFPAAFCVRHRAVSGAIQMIQDSFRRDSSLCRRWSDALDANLSEPETLVTLLLRAALSSNPNSIVLFSSRVPGHIQANVSGVGDPASDARSQRLLELVRRHVYDSR
ncbi:MAG: aldo/keto reductase [Acidobacteriaceae bacterium]